MHYSSDIKPPLACPSTFAHKRNSGTALRVMVWFGVIFGILIICGTSFLAGWELAPKTVENIVEHVQVAAAGPRVIRIPIDGKIIEVPPDSEIVLEIEDLDEANTVIRQITESSESRGSSVYEAGTEIKGQWKQDSPTASTSTASAYGGKTAFSFSAPSEVSVTSILAVLGALAIIGGIGLFFTGNKLLGLGVAIGGGVCVTAAFLFQKYPMIVLGLAVLAVIGVGYMIWRSYQGKKLKKDNAETTIALQAVVQGVKNVNGGGAEVKAEIKKAAAAMGQTTTVKKRVNKQLGET